MKAKFTVIVPTLNNVDGLIKLVDSLYKYTPSGLFKIISIFNGTEEDYRKAKDVIGEKIHLWIRPYHNLGFGKSMNLGIRLSDTDYVLLANDDVEVIYPTWWQEVEEIFSKTPNLGGFNPHSFINKRHTGDRATQYEMKDEYTTEDIDKMKEVFRNEKWYSGLICTFFTICKKAMFDKIGLFDESFGLGSGEDYDLCVRATKAGFVLAGGSAVMVKHWWGATKDNMPIDSGETTNYNMIVKGNQRMEEKWGFHSDEVKRRLADGRMTEEQAQEIKGGWPGGGAVTPFDGDKVNYEDDKWYQIVDL